MKNKLNKFHRYLLPVFVILFVIQIIAFPFAVNFTLADRSEKTNHILTYTSGKLEWSDVKGIKADGSAELSLFDAEYQNVNAENGDSVIAPGTEGSNIIRLKNEAMNEISYTAVVYEIKSDSKLPVDVSLADSSFLDSDKNILPASADSAKVIRCVSGSLTRGQVQDFDIKWLWNFDVDSTHDIDDTKFGNIAAFDKADEITVGFYLIVEENNDVILPSAPQTGDNSHITLCISLMVISGLMIVFLLVTRKRDYE